MEPIEYARIVRRRWTVIAVLVLLGLVVGYATARPAAATPNQGPSSTSYQSTVFLSLSSQTQGDPTGLSLDAMAFFATSGPVPSMTAKALGGGVSPQQVSSEVQAAANDADGVIQVTASAATASRSATVANAFSDQLVAFLNDLLRSSYQRNLASDKTQLNALSAVIAKLQGQPKSPTVQGELSQAQSQYAQQYVTYQQLEFAGPDQTGLHPIQPASAASARAVVRGGTIQHLVPSGKTSRLGLGGIAGLLVGLGLAFVWERVDTRIRTREQAEKAFGVPVLGEVSGLSHGGRSGGLVVVDHPVSAAAEAFRMLQTGLSTSCRTGDPAGRGAALLFSSPSRLEGKEAVLANLAASFSEAGHSVVLIAADSFDRALPNLVGVGDRDSAQPGSAVMGPSTEEVRASSATLIDGVSLLLDGNRPTIGNRQAKRHAELVEAARRLAEVVLIDSPPVLLTHDAGRLSSVVDSVVLMCESGRTTATAASRAAEALRRVDAPLLGVVLIARGGVRSPFTRIGRLRSSSARVRRQAPEAQPAQNMPVPST